MAVYIEIDSKCPETDERFAFLANKKFKVKTMKLGKFKVISQGLALPLSLFPELQDRNIGDDVTEVLKITYASEEDAARNVGCHYSSIKSALDKEDRKCCDFYWCTQENYKKYKPMVINKHRRTYRKVVQLDMDNNYIKTYKSLREAGDAIGVRYGNIKLVCIGERNQAGGYRWKFEDEM